MSKMNYFRDAYRAVFGKALAVNSAEWDSLPTKLTGETLTACENAVARNAVSGGMAPTDAARYAIQYTASYYQTFKRSRGTGQRGNKTVNDMSARIAALEAELTRRNAPEAESD